MSCLQALQNIKELIRNFPLIKVRTSTKTKPKIKIFSKSSYRNCRVPLDPENHKFEDKKFLVDINDQIISSSLGDHKGKSEVFFKFSRKIINFAWLSPLNRILHSRNFCFLPWKNIFPCSTRTFQQKQILKQIKCSTPSHKN